jgi:hypothetical protein
MSRQVQESLEATDRRLDIRTRWTCSLAICMLQRTWDESRFVISAEISDSAKIKISSPNRLFGIVSKTSP